VKTKPAEPLQKLGRALLLGFSLAKVDKTARSTRHHSLQRLLKFCGSLVFPSGYALSSRRRCSWAQYGCPPPPGLRSSLFRRSFRLPESISWHFERLTLPKKCPSLG
jgi:hypothetical protein